MAGPNLSKMVGPLPLGAWLAVVGGGLGIALYTRRQNAAPSLNPDQMPEDIGTTPGVGTGAVGGWTPTTPGTTPVTTAPTDNDQWAQLAIDRLIGLGYPPATVNSAITKYIRETPPFSSAEIAIINEALRKLGSPPYPVAGPVLAPPSVPVIPKPGPPAPKPGNKTGYTIHTIQPGQNMANIAAFYRAYATDIWRYNYTGYVRLDGTRGFLTWMSGKYGIEGHVGQKLVIPNAIKNYRRGV